MGVRHKKSLCVLFTVSLVWATSLGAQIYPNHLRDRWEATVSGAAVMLASRLRVDGDASPGTTIDVERILGLNKTKVQPRIALAWRPGRRHEFELGYQFVRRDAEKTLTQQFVFRDSTYRVGERVRTFFNSDQLFATYRYAFRARERSEMGLGVGLGALLFDLGLDVLVAGGGGNSVQSSRTRSFTAPSGSLGLYGKWAVGRQSYINADLRAVKVSASWLDATIYEGGLGYRFFFTPRFGAEAGYGVSSYDLTITSTRANGNDVHTFVRYTLQNLRLGVVTTL
jgi:hypothetical protein